MIRITIIFLVVNTYCPFNTWSLYICILILMILKSSYSCFTNKETEAQIRVKGLAQGHMSGSQQNEFKLNSVHSEAWFFVLCCFLGFSFVFRRLYWLCWTMWGSLYLSASQISSGLKLWWRAQVKFCLL